MNLLLDKGANIDKVQHQLIYCDTSMLCNYMCMSSSLILFYRALFYHCMEPVREDFWLLLSCWSVKGQGLTSHVMWVILSKQSPHKPFIGVLTGLVRMICHPRSHALLLQLITVKIVNIDRMLTLNVAHQTKAPADTEWRRETRKQERVGDQCTSIICSNKAP